MPIFISKAHFLIYLFRSISLIFRLEAISVLTDFPIFIF